MKNEYLSKITEGYTRQLLKVRRLEAEARLVNVSIFERTKQMRLLIRWCNLFSQAAKRIAQ